MEGRHVEDGRCPRRERVSRAADDSCEQTQIFVGWSGSEAAGWPVRVTVAAVASLEHVEAFAVSICGLRDRDEVELGEALDARRLHGVFLEDVVGEVVD